MIAQNKGKDLEKIAKSRLEDGEYYYSTKFDGNYIQIKYDGSLEVEMWTSGGKQFYLHSLGHYIMSHFSGFPFHIECEYTFGCLGKLGDRVHSARLTTYRTNLKNKVKTYGNAMKDNFYVLDIISARPSKFASRLTMMKMFKDHDWFTVPRQTLVKNLAEGIALSEDDVEEGYEGGMLKSPHHMYQPGKRSNDIIKLKPRKTADLLCIGTTMGEGKYEDMIGSLVLKDSSGREVKVGSGLDDSARNIDPDWYIGRVVEINYEQLLDTYIQPTLGDDYIRYDKTSDMID